MELAHRSVNRTKSRSYPSSFVRAFLPETIRRTASIEVVMRERRGVG